MGIRKSSIISWIITIILIIVAINLYQKTNFNEYTRSEQNLHTSKFERDSKEKYSKSNSYKIVSEKNNDAAFYKKVKVEKNKPYKVTCMVKTADVKSEENISGVGAQISVIGTTEKSVSVTGTTEWQKIEMIFNSKNREEVEIGFRLGGYQGKCTGTAWFSDFTLEEGATNQSNNWKFACFIFQNTDVVLNGKEVKLSMTDDDISDIRSTIKRFQSSVRTLSENKMTADYDAYIVNEPIKKLSYDEEFGYYVAAEDIENSIKDSIKENEYDHIFVIIRLGNDEHKDDIQINDWIGLGSMDYYGLGYSNIRLPNSSKSYMYKYNSRANTFPEEVFLHEFLHSLERNAQEYGYTIPALHDNEKYGYKDEKLIGLENWYKDYMNSTIKSSNGYVGLPQEIYTLKPAKYSDFAHPYSIDEFHEPQNIIEGTIQLFKNLAHNAKNIGKAFKTPTNNLQVNNSTN